MSKAPKSSGKTLTEDQYFDRKAELATHFIAAQAELDRVALAAELDGATDEEMKAARDAVAEIEVRQRGLEGAWRLSEQRRSEAWRIADEKRRRDDFAQVQRLIDQRRIAVAALKAIVVNSLSPHLASFAEAGAGLVAIAGRHSKMIGGLRAVSDMSSDVRSDTLHALMAALLFEEGLHLENISGLEMSRLRSDTPHHFRISPETINSRIFDMLAAILPDDTVTAQAA